MERLAHAADALIGKGTPLNGTVRLTAVPFLLNHLFPPRLVAFSRLHPGLNVGLIPDSQNLSLTRREVEVALRFGEPREGGSAVLAQKVGHIMFSVYTAQDPMGFATEDRPWLVYDPVAAHLPQPSGQKRWGDRPMGCDHHPHSNRSGKTRFVRCSTRLRRTSDYPFVSAIESNLNSTWIQAMSVHISDDRKGKT
tara:strand:- start:132 stop:716 length:585 start_codon:yes stop_codon:yes gene_type:complete